MRPSGQQQQDCRFQCFPLLFMTSTERKQSETELYKPDTEVRSGPDVAYGGM
jgi:hypothetical protein